MRKIPLLLLAIFITHTLFAQDSYLGYSSYERVVHDGVGLGAVIAVVTSWSRNRSVLWAIFHGVCSWIYVIYFVLTRDNKNLI